jgi:hypothetical protein
LQQYCDQKATFSIVVWEAPNPYAFLRKFVEAAASYLNRSEAGRLSVWIIRRDPAQLLSCQPRLKQAY